MGKFESWVVELLPTVFSKKTPSAALSVNTGIVDGAVTGCVATSKISTATAPIVWQLAAIWENSVGAGVCAASTKQICPLAAAGTSVGNAAPPGAKTKFAAIGELRSFGVGLAFDVGDQ